MKQYRTKTIFLFCALTMLIFTGNVFGEENTAPEPRTSEPEISDPIISEHIEIKDVFKPGIGMPAGEIQLVQGNTLIIHANEDFAYQAQKNLPLFKGDTIITKEKGLIRFKLNDQSIMTLASKTKLVLNRSIYDPEKKTRSTFISMGLGKVRFTVTKLLNFINSGFNVKTKTAIVGVRGSDFIVISMPDLTEVTALDNTELQVLSLTAPQTQTLLKEFENTFIKQGELPSIPEILLPEKIELIKESFKPTPGFESKKNREIPDTVSIEKKGILVSKDELITPENIVISETYNNMEIIGIKKINNIKDNIEEDNTEEVIKEQQEKITEEQQEELRRFEFPLLPK